MTDGFHIHIQNRMMKSLASALGGVQVGVLEGKG
jgi:hypothetical protein